jgi:alpha/beta hydrolase fold
VRVAFALSDGVRIHYEDRGEGPALLLVPGIPAISSDWAPLSERLAGRFRVLAYDNRGSGRSDAPPAPYTTRELAADALAVLDDAGVERAHVFGVSSRRCWTRSSPRSAATSSRRTGIAARSRRCSRTTRTTAWGRSRDRRSRSPARPTR